MNAHQSDMRRNAAIGLIAPYEARRQRGFTLVELVMVIALAGIVAVMIGTVLSRPLEGFVAQSRRAELVDLAASALNRIARDIRLAVPNSLRVNGTTQLEMLNVSAAGRYRPNRVGGEGLRFAPGTAAACTANFNPLPSPGAGDCSAFQVLDPAFASNGARWLVLYNIGAESGGAAVPGANVWAEPDIAGGNVITASTSIPAFPVSGLDTDGDGDVDETLVSVTPPAGGSFNFAYASPQRRFYLADQVIGYRCDLATGQLWRLTRTTLAPTFTGNAALMVDNVSACSMEYQPGTSRRAGLVNLRLALTLAGETIELFQQVHVDNAP